MLWIKSDPQTEKFDCISRKQRTIRFDTILPFSTVVFISTDDNDDNFNADSNDVDNGSQYYITVSNIVIISVITSDIFVLLIIVILIIVVVVIFIIAIVVISATTFIVVLLSLSSIPSCLTLCHSTTFLSGIARKRRSGMRKPLQRNSLKVKSRAENNFSI